LKLVVKTQVVDTVLSLIICSLVFTTTYTQSLQAGLFMAVFEVNLHLPVPHLGSLPPPAPEEYSLEEMAWDVLLARYPFCHPTKF